MAICSSFVQIYFFFEEKPQRQTYTRGELLCYVEMLTKAIVSKKPVFSVV